MRMHSLVFAHFRIRKVSVVILSDIRLVFVVFPFRLYSLLLWLPLVLKGIDKRICYSNIIIIAPSARVKTGFATHGQGESADTHLHINKK